MLNHGVINYVACYLRSSTSTMIFLNFVTIWFYFFGCFKETMNILKDHFYEGFLLEKSLVYNSLKDTKMLIYIPIIKAITYWYRFSFNFSFWYFPGATIMEPSKIRRVDAFEKSYTPNGQNTRVAAPNSPGTMSQRYQRFRSSLHEYGNSASFHGLRFVTDPLANKPRRLVSIMHFVS